jgi:two-component system OmpR family response regulator
MSRRRIVLVEDDDDLRLIASMSLESLGGHKVLAVESGARAVAEAANFIPDLLILDVSMPVMDGPQTLAALRQQAALRDVPAVFLTAHTQAKQVAHYRSLGAVDVIAKPFDPAQLCSRVQAILDLPPEAQVEAVMSWAPTQAGGLPEAQPTALVVEDDPGVRYLLGFILQQQGWRVLEAHDGPQALEAIQHGEVTDVALMDIMLPGIDGLKLLVLLRSTSRWRGVPVMMLTAKGDEASVARAYAAGASDYLGKPFDPADLVARLKRLRQKSVRGA